jgi:hypothetical protein
MRITRRLSQQRYLLPTLCTAHSLFYCVNYWIVVDNITRTFVSFAYVESAIRTQTTWQCI